MNKTSSLSVFVRALIIDCLISTLFSGCFYRYYFDKRPSDQPGSSWASEDGTVIFTVNESGSGFGTMFTGDETIDIYFGIGPSTEIEICRAVRNEYGVFDDTLERWSGDFFYDDHFTATVKSSTYFEVGEKIVFHRITEGIAP